MHSRPRSSICKHPAAATNPIFRSKLGHRGEIQDPKPAKIPWGFPDEKTSGCIDFTISNQANLNRTLTSLIPKTKTCGKSTTPKMKGCYNNCFKAANVISSAAFSGKPKVFAAFRSSARLLRQVAGLMPKLCDNNALKASEDTWSWSRIGLACHSLKKQFRYAKPKLPICGQLEEKLRKTSEF